ncbi:Galactose oxidase/kelch repeat superfamily protein [Hibiscus syriacus]|uniref:Galactose oxidase/kelch repeat superfamily protein n=1 Tax=Hibiscus syriacus TaxID=106335 RepID=A0A6A2Y693_HIBSY|nr:increased DNA methylation 1-like [Hibiscus syriacus]KAE8679910.1 Galactose oxidase/kelch repeat superfamily protein [Hibiscus syriacus]
MDEKSTTFAVEGEGCEEDVRKWCYHGGAGRPKNSGELPLKVKSYISSKGWVFWYAIRNGKEEPRYQSPHGEVYNSLRMACKSYIDQGSAEGRTGNVEPKQSKKRKSSSMDDQPVLESVQSELPKRGKTLKIQEAPVVKYSKQVRKGPVSRRNPRTVLSLLIDNNVVPILGKVYYRSKTGNPLMKGRITRDGIQCDCCSKVFALTSFEDHAGSTNHRPAAYIILDDGTGRSLADCQRQVCDSMKSTTTTPRTPSIVESPKTVKVADNLFRDEHDEVFSACYNGGDLICCDYCPSTFHMKCLGLKEVPNDPWFCPSCCCGICSIGYSRDKILFSCHQCELKFHVDCLKLKKASRTNTEENMALLCSQNCEKIFYGQQKLTGKPIPVGNNLSWTLLKSDNRAQGHGMKSSAEKGNQRKLRAAVEAMHECFEPSEAVGSGRDLVEDVIFSRPSKLKQLNFRGFYTVILGENDDLVSVATLRVHDNKVAEMPLVATRFRHRRRGMCQVLMDELEKNLVKLGVDMLVLPALPTTFETWTNNFGFSRMPYVERVKLFPYAILDFQGTIICQKLLT